MIKLSYIEFAALLTVIIAIVGIAWYLIFSPYRSGRGKIMKELLIERTETMKLTCYYRPDVDRPQIGLSARVCRRLNDEHLNSSGVLIAINDRCVNCGYNCQWSGLAS